MMNCFQNLLSISPCAATLRLVAERLTPKLRTFAPALHAFCLAGDIESALEVDAAIAAAGQGLATRSLTVCSMCTCVRYALAASSSLACPLVPNCSLNVCRCALHTRRILLPGLATRSLIVCS